MIGLIVLIGLFIFSLFVGKYPLDIGKILSGDEMHVRVFWMLRFSRTLVGVFGGFALGVAGFVYQTVFRNQPLQHQPSLLAQQFSAPA